MSHQDSLYPMRLHQQQVQQQTQQQHPQPLHTQPESQPPRQGEKQLAGIYAMGFDPEVVSLAMHKCGGDESRAIDCILSGGVSDDYVVVPRPASQQQQHQQQQQQQRQQQHQQEQQPYHHQHVVHATQASVPAVTGTPYMAPHVVHHANVPVASHVFLAGPYAAMQMMNPAFAGLGRFPWPAPQGTIVLKEGAVSKESDLLIGTRIKRWWFQLVWHPQLFAHLLYFEEPDRAQTLRKSIPLVGSQTSVSRARSGFPHCISVRHLDESFISILSGEASDFIDGTDDPSTHTRDSVLCFETKNDCDAWQFALSDSVARYCPPLPVQVFMNSRDVGW